MEWVIQRWSDPTLCVEQNHVIQMINGNSGAYMKVYTKTGGQVVAQVFLDAITGGVAVLVTLSPFMINWLTVLY